MKSAILLPGQVSINEIMSAANKEAESVKRRKQSRFTKREQDFILYGMDAHLDLIQAGHSIPYRRDERRFAYQVAGKSSRRNPLWTAEEEDFLEFVFQEHIDFLKEGIGTAYGKNHTADAALSFSVLNKIRISRGEKPAKFKPIFDLSQMFAEEGT